LGLLGKMGEAIYFSPAEISFINGTFSKAEKLAEKHFHLSPEDWETHRYEVKTLADLEEHEIYNRAFAHLCKYYYESEDSVDKEKNIHFYRICLQDNRILNAVERGSSFIKLMPLMLYIATHELIHIVRFNRGESDFEAPMEEKIKEEERVHSITRNILRPIADNNLNLVLDCFGNQYHIGDIFDLTRN